MRDLSCGTRSVAEWPDAALSLAAVAMGKVGLRLFLAWSHFLRKTGSPLFRKMLRPRREARLYHRFPTSNMPRKNKFLGCLTTAMNLKLVSGRLNQHIIRRVGK